MRQASLEEEARYWCPLFSSELVIHATNPNTSARALAATLSFFAILLSATRLARRPAPFRLRVQLVNLLAPGMVRRRFRWRQISADQVLIDLGQQRMVDGFGCEQDGRNPLRHLEPPECLQPIGASDQ